MIVAASVLSHSQCWLQPVVLCDGQSATANPRVLSMGSSNADSPATSSRASHVPAIQQVWRRGWLLPPRPVVRCGPLQRTPRAGCTQSSPRCMSHPRTWSKRLGPGCLTQGARLAGQRCKCSGQASSSTATGMQTGSTQAARSRMLGPLARSAAAKSPPIPVVMVRAHAARLYVSCGLNVCCGARCVCQCWVFSRSGSTSRCM